MSIDTDPLPPPPTKSHVQSYLYVLYAALLVAIVSGCFVAFFAPLFQLVWSPMAPDGPQVVYFHFAFTFYAAHVFGPNGSGQTTAFSFDTFKQFSNPGANQCQLGGNLLIAFQTFLLIGCLLSFIITLRLSGRLLTLPLGFDNALMRYAMGLAIFNIIVSFISVVTYGPMCYGAVANDWNVVSPLGFAWVVSCLILTVLAAVVLYVIKQRHSHTQLTQQLAEGKGVATTSDYQVMTA